MISSNNPYPEVTYIVKKAILFMVLSSDNNRKSRAAYTSFYDANDYHCVNYMFIKFMPEKWINSYH